MPNKIFSGIRPSGKLHLGNYLGAIKNWMELQDKPDTERAIFAVVDYHGITTPYDPKMYRQQVMDAIFDYLAAGIDPKKSLLIRQSHVPQHTELGWFLGTITPVSWLDRLPTYREKLEQAKGKVFHVNTNEYIAVGRREKNKKPTSSTVSVTDVWKNNIGLLDYPVLMAADILIYKSNLVPVGEDQMVHIDLTNEMLKRFNSGFGNIFEPVKAYLTTGARIMSLQDPTKKMSKTGDEGIALSDSPDEIREKIKRAVTDSGKEIEFDEKNKPAISNLLTIYHLLSSKEIKDIENDYTGKNYSEFKSDLAEVIVNFLKPFQQKRKELENDLTYVEDVLAESEEKARKIAGETLDEVKQKMGFL